MKTKERLAAALTEVKAPQVMVHNALNGIYDDFESPHVTPIVVLVNDCKKYGLFEFADRVKCGEFDAAASKEETAAWFEREGNRLIQELKDEYMH